MQFQIFFYNNFVIPFYIDFNFHGIFVLLDVFLACVRVSGASKSVNLVCKRWVSWAQKLHLKDFLNSSKHLLDLVRSHNVCKTVWLCITCVWRDDLDTLGWQFGRIEKMSKISFFVVTPARSCWTADDSTKSVSAELSDFGLWRQLKVESEIKSPWTLKAILNDIKNILY
jgi:hypothetical protein